MSANITLFQSDSSTATTGNAFDQDAFQDISLPASSNGSFTDTLSTNPLAGSFSNDDSLRYGPKTLYINDLVLVKDRALWIQGKPTYQIIWDRNCSYAQGYIFGNIQLVTNTFSNSAGVFQKYVSIRQTGDGIGITGVFRRCAFLVTGDTSLTATAQLAVDGANTTTVDFSDNPFSLNDENGNKLTDNKHTDFINSGSNSTRDIHDFRLTALQTSTLRLVGVVVYSENSGQNIDVFPGTSYVNKSKVTTTVGTTLPLSTFPGQLGGRSLYYKNSNGGYSGVIQNVADVSSIATGSTGTNLLNVTTGTGASFPIGTGVAAFWGATSFVGSVTNQSTDTLTVSPTLSFGISGLIYKTWSAGQSLTIGASQFYIANTFDLNLSAAGSTSATSFQNIGGFTNFFSHPTGAYRVWGLGTGYTLTDSIWPSVVATNVSLGFIQVDGFFSAADIEFVGQGILHATFAVNGLPAYSVNAGQTGCLKKTVFTGAGPGWNSVQMHFGASQGAIGINRINLYQTQSQMGLTTGLLAYLDTIQNYVKPGVGAVNATFIAPGTFRRYFADQLLFQGSWVRGSTSVAAGGVHYIGSSTNSVLTHTYYGKNFAVLGVNATQGYTMTVDGVGTACTLNIMNTVASEGWHTVVLGLRSGTGAIHGFDITRTQGELFSLTNSSPIKQDSSLVFGSSRSISASEATSFTPTFTNFTVSLSIANFSRFGDKIYLQAVFLIATVAAAEARMSLPNALTANVPGVTGGLAFGVGSVYSNSGGGYQSLLAEPGAGYVTFGTAASPNSKQNANAAFGAGAFYTVQALIPITGWNTYG